MSHSDDPFGLSRFLDAQRPVYQRALRELRDGRKSSHWMWFVFPQLRGLGESRSSDFFGLSGVEEARAYLQHPLLGARLRECVETLLALRETSADSVFGETDALKLKSSMTLFARAAPEEKNFRAALDAFYGGEADARTIEMLEG